MLYWLGAFFFWLIYKFIYRLKIYGGENIPRSGGVIIVSNHSSWWDPPLVGVAVGAVCGRPVYFIAKEELFRIPFFGYILRKVHAFPLKREGVGASAFKKALELLEMGKMIVIFPQGTRKRQGEPLRAKPGVGMLIEKSGSAVLPVLLKNTSSSGRFYPFKVRFGSVIDFSEGCNSRDYREKAQKTLETIFRLEDCHS